MKLSLHYCCIISFLAHIALTSPFEDVLSTIECGVPHFKPNVSHAGQRQRWKPNEFIYNGTVENPHSWPWQALVVVQGDHCGGSLIAPKWVITAAHCFDDIRPPLTATVVLGAHDITKKETTQFKVQSRKVMLHPQYNQSGRFDHDFALIKLQSPAPFNDYIRPVCLPTAHKSVRVGDRGYVTGWGITDGKYTSPVPMQVVIPVVDIGVCSAVWSKRFAVNDASLCGGYMEGGKDSCKGDSGGPWVFAKNNVWFLEGIVSLVYCCVPCVRVEVPAVYSKVLEAIPWIADYLVPDLVGRTDEEKA